MPEISSNMVSTFHPLHPGIAKRLIMSGFQQDEQQLPSLEEMRNQSIEKGGAGSGRRKTHAETGIKEGDEVKVPHNLTHDPYNLRGEKVRVKRIEGDTVHVHHKNGGGKYDAYALEKCESGGLAKSEFNTSKRKKLAKEGEARKDGSFPIRNAKDLKNAIHDVGRANNPAGAKSWIKKRAKELNLEHTLPEDWHKAEDVTESVGEGPGIEGSVKKSEVEKAFENLFQQPDPVQSAFDALMK